MGSKTLVLAGLLLAMVLLISSQVAARQLDETVPATMNLASGRYKYNEVAAFPGGGFGRFGGGRARNPAPRLCDICKCGGNFPPACRGCCPTAGQKADVQIKN